MSVVFKSSLSQVVLQPAQWSVGVGWGEDTHELLPIWQIRRLKLAICQGPRHQSAKLLC